MNKLAAVTLALGLATSGFAYAQEDPIAHYQAFQEAAASGDYETASAEGEAAWRAAEAAWGEDPDTGLLAFSVAQLRVNIMDRAGAAEPAQRAVELAALAEQTGAYNTAEAQLLHGVAIANSNPAAAKTELQTALDGLKAAGVQPRDDIIRAKLDLALLKLSDSADDAVALAQEAVNDSRGIESANLRNHLADLGRIQYLGGKYAMASGSLGESIGMWPEQAPGEMPAELADSVAWYAIAGKANEESTGQVGPFGPFNPSAIPFQYKPKRTCRLEWEDSDPVAFPEVPGDSATLGAAVIMYDLNADGTVADVRIAGAAPAPQKAHNDLIVNTMGTWQIDGRIREECMIGQQQIVTYFY